MSLRPGFVEPMKALSRDTVPSGLWRCEIKFDGYRAVAVLDGKRVQLWSRNHKTLDADYPEIIAALRTVRCRSAVLDGEIVALDEKGRSRFQLLQARELGERPRLAFYLFDLLQHDGRDFTARPIEERRHQLEKLLRDAKPPLQLSPEFTVEPARLLRAAERQGLEGIIAKRPASLYESGRRSGAWLKCKVHGEQEFVIGGFTPPQRSRLNFGAILVGFHEHRRLIYAGKVGTGFNQKALVSLHRRFLALRRSTCPFADLPREKRSRFGTGMTAAEMRRATWLRPTLVAQIKFAEWTNDGLLRQPVFLGLRKDKKAADVVREELQSGK
ncbi:MAG TPA: non-homologous end-joining DNA ligase [Candidatus Didemnitutus sp.]|nr:non-homologous end-joining DNA ligase [Candidatus Didemnitutus sp.]